MRGRAKQFVWAGVVAVAVVVAAAVALVGLGGDDAEGTDLRLEPIGASFEGDFAGNLDVLAPGGSLALALPGVPPLGAALGGSLAGLRGTPGDEPGLYGGSRSVATCDVDALAQFLLDPANGAKAAAWSTALGIDEADIAEFIAGLTPVRLRVDTAVTNHGFVDGRANPIPAVLEAGTAVLVDDEGVPRVKCNCGNPLAPPSFAAADLEAADDDGDAWDGFDPDRVNAVQPGSTVEEFVTVDIDDGALFARPVGTNGEADVPVPADAATCGVFADSPTCTGVGLTPDVEMPDVTGSTVDAATEALDALGFLREPTVTEEASEQVPAGVVIRSEPPAGRLVPAKSPVTLVVSSGPDTAASSTTTSATAPTGSSSTSSTAPVQVDVPDVAGLSQRAAQGALFDAGLGSFVTFVPSDQVPEGLAIGTEPPAGSAVPEGTTVELFVSTGPDVVTVPDVVGLLESDARAVLRDAGLGVVAEHDQGAPPESFGRVTVQDPQAGSVVPRGTTVTITVGAAPG